MSLELYYTPSDDTAAVSLATLIAALEAEGLDVTKEDEATEMYWLTFERHTSALLVSESANLCPLITLHFDHANPADAALPAILADVLDDLGYEDAEA